MTTAVSAPFVIGLDVGTSAVKCAVYGPGGRRGDTTERSVPITTDATGRATQEPARIRDAVLDALAACVAATDVPIAAVSTCSALHGLVGLDADGEAVTDLLTWADTRARGIVTAWWDAGRARWLHSRSGVPVHPMAPVAKLAWLGTHEPGTAARVARWADLKALIVEVLCGDIVTETSSASGWGLADPQTGTWDPELVDLAEVRPGTLPPIEPVTAVRPLAATAASRTGLTSGTPVVLGAGDGPLGNVGVGALTPGTAALSLGTSGAVRVTVDRFPTGLADDLFCYGLDDTRRVLGGAVSNGGSVVAWLAATLLADSSDRTSQTAAVMELAAGSPPGANGLVMVPYLVGERAPLWDPDLTGAYLGLEAHHTRADLARAALEGVAASLAVITDRIATVEPIATVRATGGALGAPVWRQVLAGALGRPLTVPGTVDGSAHGAAALGLVAIGAVADLPEALGVLDDGSTDDTVPVDDEVVEAAARTRRLVAERAAQLVRIGAAFA